MSNKTALGLVLVVVLSISVVLIEWSAIHDRTQSGIPLSMTAASSSQRTLSVGDKGNMELPDPSLPPYLPSKVFIIVGIESSGTTFLTETISHSLGLGGNVYPPHAGNEAVAYGATNHFQNDTKSYMTEVQHVSLPWGGYCSATSSRNINPVVFPLICTRIMRNNEQTARLFATRKFPQSDFGKMKEDCRRLMKGRTNYGGRYILDLTTHFEWYRNNGMDAHMIIIARDDSISKRARALHCRNPSLRDQEETVSMKSITNFMDKYFVDSHEEVNANRRLSVSNSSTLEKENVMRRRRRRQLGRRDATDATGKVLLVSYEVLMKLKFDYLKLIYDYFHIDSDYNPRWKDGNGKYVRST